MSRLDKITFRRVVRAARIKAEGACPECGIKPPGHKLDCKTGNERARAYQSGLAAKQRVKKKPMFTVIEAAQWAERNGFAGTTAAARLAMEDAATLRKAGDRG
jgi:hypothetical protein